MLNMYPVHPTLPASDLERAKTWYKDKLGLVPDREHPAGLEYECAGGTKFVLYPTQFAGTAQNTAVEFEVTGIASVMDSLRASGVVFQEYDLPGLKTVNGIAQIGPFKGCWFKDSEGNIIAMTEQSPE